MGTSDFTIAMWVKRKGTGNQQALISKGRTAAKGMAGWIVRTQGLRMDDVFLKIGDGKNDFALFTKPQIKDDRWHHVAFVVDRDSQADTRAYVDGIPVTGPKQGSLKRVGSIDVNTPACIADRGDKGRTWNGALDDIRIYNRALTGPEVRLLCGAVTKSAAPPIKLGSGKVLDVDGKNLSLLLDTLLPAGAALRGQMICLTSKAAARSHFVVDRIEREGSRSRVFIAPGANSFANNTGLITEVINPRTFVTGSYFRHGNWGQMRKGDVVLISGKTFRIGKVEYSGWKKRSRVRVTLDADALKDSSRGGRFVVSAVAPGDAWDMELIVRMKRVGESSYVVTCPLTVSVKPPPGVRVETQMKPTM